MRKIILAGVFCGLLACGNSGRTAEEKSARPADPARWLIADTTVFLNGQPANVYVGQLLDWLAAEQGAGQPVNREEFRQILQRVPSVVYADKVIKYATPKSVALQNHDHEVMVKKYLEDKWMLAGVDFIKKHEKELTSAQKGYQVAVNDLVSILLWESQLGNYAGDLLVFNVLLGQILYLDQAREWAVEEILSEEERKAITSEMEILGKRRLNRLKRSAAHNLSVLIRTAQEKNMDVTSLKGSWGGAMGYVQFMPSSMQFAVDGDSNGVIDLYTWPDAIHSAANFLNKNGYRATQKGRRRAIHAYNPLDSYVRGVVQYADSLGHYRRHLPAEAITP